MPELTFLSAASMAEQIQQKKLSPVDLIEAHLTRIQELNPTLNAFVQIDVEGEDGLKFTPVKPRHKEPAGTGAAAKP